MMFVREPVWLEIDTGELPRLVVSFAVIDDVVVGYIIKTPQGFKRVIKNERRTG